MSLRKRKDQLIKLHLDSKAARYGVKRMQIEQNRKRSVDYRIKLHKYKEANKSVRENIKKKQKNLGIEREKLKNYKSLVDLQETNLKKEKFTYEKKKDDFDSIKQERLEVEKEIYRLENILKGIQSKRGDLEEKYEKLEGLKAERDQEIQIIHQNIKEKEEEIEKSQKVIDEIEENLDQIMECTLKM